MEFFSRTNIKSLLLILSGFILQSSNAQMVSFTQSFDATTFPPTGWSSLGTGWSRQTTGTSPTSTPKSGAGFARFNSFSLTTGTTGTLITPAFDLQNRGANTPTVSFWIYRDNGYNNTAQDLEGITIYMNTSASLTGATSLGYIPRRIGAAPTVAGNGWYQYTFNIPASFNSANNYVLVHAYSAFGNNIFIDDVTWQSYPANRNIGVSNILNPVGGNCGNSSDTVKVRVTNFSTYSANNFTVKATITGTVNGSAINTTLSTVYTPTLTAGSTVDIPVGVISNASGSASINISAFTEYANDLTKTNDTTKSGSLTLNRRPAGSLFSINDNKRGILGAGTSGNPDILKVMDSVYYSLTAPASYTIANYGSSWTISSAELKSGNTTVANPQIVYNGSTLRLLVIAPIANVGTQLSLQLTFTDMNTGCTQAYNRIVFAAPVPKVNFSFGTACASQPLTFENNSSISSGTMTFEWDYGDPNQSNDGDQTRIYKNTGNYVVKLTGISNYGFTKDTSITVTVNPNPVAEFTVQNACEGIALNFTDNSSVASGSISSAQWNFGDGTMSMTPSHIYSSPGAYNVTLTVTSDKGCSSSKTRRAIQHANPDASFTVSDNCSNKDIIFTNTSVSGVGSTYVWDLGNGTGPSTANATRKYSDADTGMIKVKLFVTSSSQCKDSAIQMFNIRSGPVAAFTANNLCSAKPVQFSNSSSYDPAATLTWTFDGKDSSSDANPVHLFDKPGNSKVKLHIMNPNGCEAMLEQSLNIKIQPLAMFSVKDDSVCSGESVSLVNESNTNGAVVNYVWDMGNGEFSTAANPSHVFNNSASKSYNVKLRAFAFGGCADSIEKTVFVSKLPSCDFTIVSDLTGERRFTFTASEAGNSNTWNFGDGILATGNSNFHQFIFDGTYNITLTSVNQTGCVCQSSKTLSVIKLGVNDPKVLNSLQVYPNPNNGKFNVSFENVSKVKSMGIYNMLGELIQSIDVVSSVDNVYSVDMNNISSGVYFVKAETENGLVTRKFTVSK